MLRMAWLLFRSKQVLMQSGKEEGVYINGQITITTTEQGVVDVVRVTKPVLIRLAKKGHPAAIAVIGFNEVVQAIYERKLLR